jgi:predicted nucleic acid-binding protein
MYLVGAAHPNKQLVIAMVPRLLHAREDLVTSAEAFQEVVHRYGALRDFASLLTAYEGLEAIVGRTVDVTKVDVDRARDLAGRFKRLSSRDCLHLAVMRRVGCDRIWSFDTGFDRMPGVVRIS